MRKVHFVGICGIGMSSLAQHLYGCGYEVSGSDIATNTIQNAEIRVFRGHSAENIPKGCSLVVFSEAIPTDNCELAEARRRNIPVVPREVLLGKVFNSFDKRVAVCGVHGKTTTAAMIDFILRQLSVDHAAFIGGAPCDTGSNYTAGRGIVVAEACEYKRSFLQLTPDVAVALNVELDHPDCYADYDEILDSFRQFFRNVPSGGLLIANGDYFTKEAFCGKCVTFGFGANNDVQIFSNYIGDGKYAFSCNILGENVSAELPIYGKHNVLNAAAALIVCKSLGLPLSRAAEKLQNFCGVRRRWTELVIGGVRVAEDYAHHPTEVAAVVETAKNLTAGRIFVFFQPHTYTRTKALWNQFAGCFSGADFVGLLPIYAAREQPVANVTSENLLSDVVCREKAYFENFEKAAQFAENNLHFGDTALVVGAGDVYLLAELIRTRLKNKFAPRH